MEEGVLATFNLDGKEAAGRVVRVSGVTAGDPNRVVVEIELIDEAEHRRQGKTALTNLPPANDAVTDV